MDLSVKMREVEESIKNCESRIREIESSIKSRIFSKKELQRLKENLVKLEKQRSDFLSMHAIITKQEKLARKKDACQELIDQVSTLETIHEEGGKEIALVDDVKLSFIDTLKDYQSSDQLFYTYSYEETDDYSIREEFVLNAKGNVGIRVTTNDFGIAAKSHAHLETVDEMLSKYSKHLESQQSENKGKKV